MAATDLPARRDADSLEARIYTQSADVTGGLFLGIGVGGFIDGISLQQILQWHSMGSSILPPITMTAMAQNMRWDGYFNVVTLLLALVGVVALWREGLDGTSPPSLRVLIGQMILGWGIFNLVEGLVAHVLLELHHVRDLPAYMPLYDWIFLGVGGFFFILFGWLLSRTTAADFLYRSQRRPVAP